ncbi:MAG: hypothetical protein JXQ73_17250 [Phycisphaerae bacterium]|nr:hypothetical protein [Phycisphaerae bacterium]
MATKPLTSVYPQPQHVEVRRGRFVPPKGPLAMKMSGGAPKWVKAAAGMAAREVGAAARRRVTVGTARKLPAYTVALGSAEATTALRGDRTMPAGTRDQGYEIEVKTDGLTVRGTGWAGLGLGLRTLLDCCDAGLRCARICDAPRFGIRSMLIHLSYNQWRHTPSKEIVYGFSDRLRFDKPVFDEVVALMARLRMNMVILDMGDAVRYRSHPEIAVKGALTTGQLRRLLDQCRGLGLEPIPKLNFATTHDAWLKEYGLMVGTPEYHDVCDDLIAELMDLFGGPRFFHIGMDEETIGHCRGIQIDHMILREGKAWLDAVERLDRSVRRCGARTWMWGDPLWPEREGEPPAIPKRILVSDWNYSKRTTFPTSKIIEQLGYDNIPAGANWTEDENALLLARFAAKHLDPKRTPGMMMTSWNPTVKSCRCNLLNAVSLAAGAFWNPNGPSTSPWPRDHYAGHWGWKKKP